MNQASHSHDAPQSRIHSMGVAEQKCVCLSAAIAWDMSQQQTAVGRVKEQWYTLRE
jgi:hypothetical protein